MSKFLSSLIAAGVAVFVTGASAAPVTWTDWTTADGSSASGAAGGITVSFSGALAPAAQTNGGTNYWASNPATYTSAEVDNGPADSDIIRLTGGTGAGVQTLTFSAPVTDPVMAILSLGRVNAGVQYDFDTPFDVLNWGPGHWGNGPLTELAGDVLEGYEGHGIIQFDGTVSSISWTIPVSEYWHGFQIGLIDGPGPDEIAAPATLPVLGMALLGLGLVRRRH